MFEAGALAKAVDSSLVAPILFGVAQSDLRDSPLVQFQMTEFEKEEVRKLVHSINRNDASQRLADVSLNSLFDALWPDLERDIAAIRAKVRPSAKRPQSESDVESKQSLEEVVVNTRNILKRLASQEQMATERHIGQQPIHRLERNALDRALKEAQILVRSISNLKNEIGIELSEGADLSGAQAAIVAEVEKVEREANGYVDHVVRMRNRILQLDE